MVLFPGRIVLPKNHDISAGNTCFSHSHFKIGLLDISRLNVYNKKASRIADTEYFIPARGQMGVLSDARTGVNAVFRPASGLLTAKRYICSQENPAITQR
jgi:hypothetical protein